MKVKKNGPSSCVKVIHLLDGRIMVVRTYIACMFAQEISHFEFFRKKNRPSTNNASTL